MADDVHDVNRRHHAFYEVGPYYVELAKLPEGREPAMSRIQAGYDVDVYGFKADDEPQPSPDYELVYDAIRDAVKDIGTSEGCTIEVIPFPSSVVLDSRSHLEAQGRVCVRVTHSRGLEQPAGPAEADALRQVEDRLQKLGINPGGGRSSGGL